LVTAVLHDPGYSLAPLSLGKCSDKAPEWDWRRAESKWQQAELPGWLQASLKTLSEQALVLQRCEYKLGLSWASVSHWL
jgi:hypothetical protein